MPVHKKMWQAHPNKTNLHSVDSGVLDQFKTKVEEINASVSTPLREIARDTRFSGVQPPEMAYARAFGALDWLQQEFGAWRDFLEVVRGLQRSLIELLAFADWWHDVQEGEEFNPPFRARTRGAIFEDGDLYVNHVRWSIASYLIIPNDCCALDPMKRVDLSPRTLSRTNVISNQPLQHTLRLWYYPPDVGDVHDFETVARGYADRLDTFNPTKGYKRILDKLENQRADDGRLLFLDPF
jgi:hypothetical protein